jgi:hypothetical protein
MTNPKKKQKTGALKVKKAKVLENATVVEEDRDIDEHPLHMNHFLVIKYRDNSHRIARVTTIVYNI